MPTKKILCYITTCCNKNVENENDAVKRKFGMKIQKFKIEQKFQNSNSNENFKPKKGSSSGQAAFAFTTSSEVALQIQECGVR